uniref:Uncharacterized protein n=1 Tax=Tanacetum cinerariifolium TaxID=118510 RepID=A0A699GG65_TANCI|nr:hypothetical protein [Tanacetum cinerariifolium]
MASRGECLFSNTMSLVGPVWANIVMHNVTNDVTMLHFVEEGNDIFYVSTYNKYGLKTHGYTQKSLMFWRCLFPVISNSRQAQFEPKAYPTLKSDKVDLFVNDREYKSWHKTHGDEHRAFYKKLTPKALKLGRINIPKEFGDIHKLRGYSSAVTTVWILAWGKLVLTGVDDVTLPVPTAVLMRVVPCS